MSVLRADYFDGKLAQKREVSVVIAAGRLKLVGRDVAAEFDARRVRVSPRIGNTPRWLYLPGGGACAVADNEAMDRFARERRFARLLHRLESRPAFAALAVALVVGSLWLLVDRGVPAAAERIAREIPPAAETALGEEALAGMEKYWMKPTALPASRQKTLREKFNQMARAAGASTPPRLEFRASPAIGPNAFALPGSLIVATDELVALARNDAQVLAVLAHELGHVNHRHVMRQLLQGSATALIIAGVTGDIASTTSLAAAAPGLLLQTKFSRDYEREADAFAIELLQKTGIGPQHLAAILARLEAKVGKGGGLPGFLSSHPRTQEREALALAAGGTEANESEQDAEETAAESAPPERPQLAIIDPEQRRIADLLEKRDYAELERVLGGYQSAFERDEKNSRPLENVFRVFRKIPRQSDAALSAWIQANPSSYVATLARGVFYISQGIQARGTKFVSDTPEENLRAMQDYLKKAGADLQRSLALAPKPYLSRRYLMTVALYVGQRGENKAQFEEAVKLAPTSVETRLAYMTNLEPRWGGSYAEMEAFLKESRSVLDSPGANRLAARIAAYRGSKSTEDKNYPKAMEYLNEAVRLDDDADHLCARAYVLGELGRREEAFKDAARAIEKSRDNEYCMSQAAYFAYYAGDTAEAVRVLNLVIEVNPQFAPAYNQRGWAYQRQNKAELAFADYLVAAKLGDAWAQKQVGNFYWSGAGVKQDRDEAIAWLEKSAEQGNEEARASLAQAKKQREGKSP